MNIVSAHKFLDNARLDTIIHPRKGIQTYRNNTIDFDPKDKSLLIHLLNKVQRKFQNKCLLEIGNIQLILLKRGCYWNFPFTLNNTIVFTPELLDKPHSKIVEILIHEVVHIDQKRNQKKYDDYYATLGFERYDIDFGELTQHLLDNPDGVKYEWLWNNKYIPCAVLTPDLKFRSLILEINTNHNSYDDTHYKVHELDKVPIYNNRFGTLRQLYHPNEISAHLISDWIYHDKEHVQVNYDELVTVLNR